MEKTYDRSIKLLIISDNMLRVGIRMILDTDPSISVVGEASSSVSSVEIAARREPDISLIDLDLFGVHIVSLMRDLRKVTDRVLPLILGSLGNEDLISKALTSGAAGVVLKIQPPAVLIAAIQSLCEGESHVDRHKMQPASALFNNSPNSHAPKKVDLDPIHQRNPLDPESEKIHTLTTREREIIHLIAKGLANKDIADRLCISDVTVRHHLTNIFDKLEVSNRQKLLILAHHYGLADLTLTSEAVK